MTTIYDLVEADISRDLNYTSDIYARSSLARVFAQWLRDRGFEPGDAITSVTVLTGRLQLYFGSDAKPAEVSRVLRHFVAVTGIRLTKCFVESVLTFQADGRSEAHKMNVTFTNFIPQACHLVEEEVEIPEKIVAAHTEKRTRAICNPPEEVEGDVVADEPATVN